MRIDLTVAEVREVGASRWTERIKWRLFAGFALIMVLSSLFNTCILRESSDLVIIVSGILCLLWFFWQRSRKGKAFLKQAQQDEGSTDEGGLVK